MLAAIGAAGPTLVIGTDCPVLEVAHLQQAAAALATHDAVLIPAEDGGYVLIGLRRAQPEVFADVAWGTPQVLATTRQRLRSAGLSLRELPALWDIDRPADLARLLATRPDLAGAPAAA
jgi:glycosyltransferase A (GT-A) superfamily protein (DUF2064 family)